MAYYIIRSQGIIARRGKYKVEVTTIESNPLFKFTVKSEWDGWMGQNLRWVVGINNDQGIKPTFYESLLPSAGEHAYYLPHS